MSSCTLWVMPQDFNKWKTLLRYISVASFISIVFVVVKVFCIDWRFLGPYSPKYCSILLKFWPEVVPNKTNTVLEKSFEILNFSLNGRHVKFTVLFHFAAQCTAGKPKIMLKIKIFTKTGSLRISNSISTRSQKNHRVLVKLNKKTFFGPKLGLNCPLWLRQGVIINSHIVYNENIPLHVLGAKFQFLCICSFCLYLEESLRVFGLQPNCAHFGGFWSNN